MSEHPTFFIPLDSLVRVYKKANLLVICFFIFIHYILANCWSAYSLVMRL